MSAPTPEEVMTVAAARELADGEVVLVGVGPPNAAANLARRLHAPGCVLVYESGAIGAKPLRLPLSIGDDDLAATADELVSVPEMFAYWIGAGRIDVGFLGAAQIDRRGNINTTVIGPYDHPKVRLPGAGGAPEIAAAAKEALDLAEVGVAAIPVTLFAVGLIVSGIVGYLTIKYFLRYLANHSLAVFAYYRFALAAVTALWIWTR